MFVTVTGETCSDVDNSGTLVWDPKVVENLTDEECECIIVFVLLLFLWLPGFYLKKPVLIDF